MKSFADDKHIVIIFNNKNTVLLTVEDIINNNQQVEILISPVISGKYQMLTTNPTYVQMSYLGKKGQTYFQNGEEIKFLSDVPNKCSHLGHIRLTPTWLLLFGGVAEQGSTSRD